MITVKNIYKYSLISLCFFFLSSISFAALQKNVIINEFYWHTTGGGKDHYEAVELLVLKPNLDLNNLCLSDRNTFDKVSENVVTLNDNKQGFLKNLKPGTLIVIYNGEGKDDVDSSDYIIRLYSKSSPFATNAGKNSFSLNDKGDNLHIYKGKTQYHFIKYRSSDYPKEGDGRPGKIPWKGGKSNYINTGLFRLNAGTKFASNSYEKSLQPHYWESYSIIYPLKNNLGLSNGGENSKWIASLRNITLKQLMEIEGTHSSLSDNTLKFDKTKIQIAPTRIPLNQFVIQSHRGAGFLVPENTIPAFEYGWKINTSPEADLHTTKDGVIVAFHDKTFKRLVKDAPKELKNLTPEDLTWDQLCKLDVGSWKDQKYAGLSIPRIEQLFEYLKKDPKKRMYLDIKNVNLEQLVEIVKSYNVQHQVTLASKYHHLHKQWKQLLPESQTLQWIGGGQDAIQFTIDSLRAEDFTGLTSIQIHVRYDASKPDPFIPSSNYIAKIADEMHKRNITLQILPWKVWDQKVYWMLLNLGIDSFATDYPDVTIKAVQNYYKKQHPTSN